MEGVEECTGCDVVRDDDDNDSLTIYIITQNLRPHILIKFTVIRI